MNPVNIANLGVEDIVPDKMPGEKVARGVIGGTEDFATGVVNFLSVAGPAGHLPGGAARLISAGFSADMLWNAWNSIPAFRKEIKAGNVEGAVRVATGGLASAYLGQKLGRSATKGGAAVLKEAAAKAKSGITGDPLRVDPAVAATAPTAAPAVPSEVPPPAAPVTPLAASRTRVAARKAKLAPPPEAEAPAPTEVPPVASQAAGESAPIVWNAGEAATAAAPAPAKARLPRDLTGAKPRYSEFELDFASDTDRAAYISAQKIPSKRDADYVLFAMRQTGLSEAEVRAHGVSVRSSIKELARDAEPGQRLAIPELTPAAPKAAAPSITIPPKPKFENSLEGKAAKAKFEAKERADGIKAKAKAEADALKAQAKAATDDLKQRAKDQKDAERSRQDTLKAQATEAKVQEETAAEERKAKIQGMTPEDVEREIAEAIPKLTDAQLLDYVEEQKVERAAKPGEPETPLTSTQIAVADELVRRKAEPQTGDIALSPELQWLHDNPVRLRGFASSPRGQVKVYLERLRSVVERNAPESLHLVDDAISEFHRGYPGLPGLAERMAEQGLQASHIAEANEGMATRQFDAEDALRDAMESKSTSPAPPKAGEPEQPLSPTGEVVADELTARKVKLEQSMADASRRADEAAARRKKAGGQIIDVISQRTGMSPEEVVREVGDKLRATIELDEWRKREYPGGRGEFRNDPLNSKEALEAERDVADERAGRLIEGNYRVLPPDPTATRRAQPQVDEFSQEAGPTAEEMPQGAPPATAFRNPAGTYRFVSEEGGKVTFDFTNNKGNVARNVMPSAEWDRGAERREPILEPITVPEPEQATPVSPGPAKLRAAAEAAKAKTEAVKAKLTGEKVAEAPVAAPETAKSGIGVKAEAATTATPRAEADFETAYQKELYDFRNPREHAYPAMDLLKDWSTLDKTGTVTVRDLSNNDPGSMSTITTETRTEGRGAKRKTIGTYIVKTSQGKTYTFEWSGEDSKDWDAAKALARATGKYDNFQEIHGAMVNEGEYVGYHEKRYALREALKKAFPDKIIPEISTAVKVPKNPSLSDAITAVAESIPRNLWDLPTHGDIEPALKAFESRAKQSAEIIGREHPRVLELQKLVDDARAEAKQKQVLSEARETTAKENSRREIEASAKMDAEYYARFGTTDGESLPDLWKYAKLADWKEAKEGPETGRGAAVNERALREFDIEKKQLEPLDVSGIKFGKTDLDILREARLSPGGTVIPRRMSIGQEAEWKSRGWLDEGGSQLTELGERAALGLRQMDTRLQAGLPFSEYKPGTGRVPDPGENRFTANAPIPYKGDVYHTDGHILVLGPPPKYWSAPKTTPTSLPDVGRVMPKESGKTIAPIGFADKSSGIGPKTLVFFSNEVALDSKYFDYVSRLHSPDKWTSEGGKDNAVQAWKDGKRVGIIMPVKAEVPPGLTDLVGKPVATAPNPLAAASARAKEAVAARKAKLTGKESERGAISLTRADVAPAVEKLKRAGKEVGKFATDVYHGAQPLGSVLKREGNVGKGLMRTIETATDMGEVKGAGRIADMKEAGLDTLSREEQFNLHDALQGRAAPMNTKVEDVFDAARVVLEDTGLEMERRGITAQEKVTIPPGGPVPPGYKLNSRQKLSLIAAERANRPVTLSLERLAKARHDYYPQVMASVDALKSGHVRTDIAANIERMGLRPDRAQAEAFIDRWVQFLESGKRDDVLIKHLVDTGQVSTKPEALAALMSMRERALGRQKMGSMEYARQVNLPFYDPIPGRVLPNWVLKGSVFLERAGQLGQKGEVVKKAVYDIRKAGGDYVAVRDAAARILGAVREPDTGTNQALRAVRTWQGFKLALSAIPNAIQPFNVLLKSDAATLLAGVRGSMTKEGRAFGERSGAVLENVIQEALKNAGAEGEALSKFLKWNAFIPVEKNNRIISANAGRFYAQRLLNQLKLDPASKKARYRMEELGLRPDEILHRGSLSLGDQFMAAKKMSDITQFRSRPQDLPGVFSTSWGKVVFQFKNYSYQQGRIVFDSVVGEMRRGEYGEATKNLLVLATVFPLAGRAVSELRNAITGRKEDREAWDAYWGSVTQAGAAGLVGDLMQSGAWGTAAAALGGPTLADAADLINLVGKKDVGRSAAKLAFRRIPMIGPIFVNRVFPPKAKSSDSKMRKTY